MIVKLFNHPHILHQTPDCEDDMPNTPIAGHIDDGGTSYSSRKAATSTSTAGGVPELCKLLKKLATLEVN